ncbi:probable inactive histone-lysine N-methyltransferase SUVR2 [Salvia hispanica]|uniref:probable inactive histone-lysine N-methyltransferase SUVR2 n=1 Tax=Salvia hispanica TaxID=49212 RepID=UPI0020090895|nr:probable inactive histone-lysine N-methyltransferase SUVR2 [Salvia hispanica]
MGKGAKMKKEREIKFANAIEAMNIIGIKEEKVLPVLKTLVKLCDDNWALIEEGNYRALADAILVKDERDVEEQPRKNVDNGAQDHLEKEAREAEEPERPMKILKHGHLNHQTSSSSTSNTSMSPFRPKEPDKLSEMHCIKLNGTRGMEESPQNNAKRKMVTPLVVTSQSFGQSKGKQPSSSNSLVNENGDPNHPSSINGSQKSVRQTNAPRIPSHPMRLRDRGAGAASLQTPSRTVSKSSSHAIQQSEPKVPDTVWSLEKDKIGNDAIFKTKDAPTTDDEPHISHGGDSITKPTSLQYVRERRSTADVTMVLCESRNSGKLGTDLNRQSVIGDTTKSSAAGVRGAEALVISSLNGMVGSRSGADVPKPKSKVLSPPLNGRSGRPQLNKLNTEDNIVVNRENQGNCPEDINGLRWEAVQQPQLNGQTIKPIHDFVDISKGQEKFPIALVNEVNDERPPSFCYIRQNAIYQNAYANFCLARIGDNSCCSTCSGDCLSLSLPCACSYESGGEFAYTADGLVKEELLNECISMNLDPKQHCQFFCQQCPLERSKREDSIEPCKGHLVRSFIKECWIKCGCNIQCGNRVVQRGISRKLQVFMTPEGKGWGLRTLEDLPKGAFVCEYVGEVLTNAELFERVLSSPEGEKHSYPVLLDADWCAEGVLKDEEALCLDATYYGNVARFINHKCYDSTLVEIPVEVETPDHHYYHLAFFTSRKVKAMEELTWDYGIDFDDHDHPIKAFRCQCGSEFCRDI